MMELHQVHVFIADTGDFSHEMCVDVLSEDDRAKLKTISKRSRRLQFALGRYLLREALHILFGELASTWKLAEHRASKPRLVGDGAPEFSLSHSHERIACAIASVPVGIDIEYRRERDFQALTRFICTDDEWHDFQQLDAGQHKERFYQLWLLKEATYKALGQDMEITSTGYEFEDKPKLVTRHPGIEHIDLCVFTHIFGYMGALSVLGPGPYQIVYHDVTAKDTQFLAGS